MSNRCQILNSCRSNYIVLQSSPHGSFMSKQADPRPLRGKPVAGQLRYSQLFTAQLILIYTLLRLNYHASRGASFPRLREQQASSGAEFNDQRSYQRVLLSAKWSPRVCCPSGRCSRRDKPRTGASTTP